MKRHRLWSTLWLLVILGCSSCQTTPSGQRPAPTTDPATWPPFPVPLGVTTAAVPTEIIRTYRPQIRAAPQSNAHNYERIGLAAYSSTHESRVVRAQINQTLQDQSLPQSYVDSVDLYLAEGWTFAIAVEASNGYLFHIIGLTQERAQAYGSTDVPTGGSMIVYVLYTIAT